MLVHLLHHGLGGMGAGDRQHLGMGRQRHSLLGSQAPGDDSATVLVEGLANGIQGFLHRRIDEAAGIHDDQIGFIVASGNLVALPAQAGEDMFRVNGRFGAPERNKPHSRWGMALFYDHSVGARYDSWSHRLMSHLVLLPLPEAVEDSVFPPSPPRL